MILAALLLACEPELPSEGSFSALTYNVQGLPDALTEYPWPLAERMDLIAPFLRDDALIGLQEDFDADAHARLVAQADHPIRPWFQAPVDDTRVYGAGLGLLARGFDDGGYVEEHYTDCNGTLEGAGDCFASKGFQVQTLVLGDGLLLDVYNTHHEAGGGEADNAARAAQVEQVIASMDGRSAGRAVMLLGDTNLRPSDTADQPLLARYASIGLRDACEEIGCPEADHIDRFLLRDGDALALSVTAWENLEPSFVHEGALLSDHPPLRAQLAWSAR